MAREFTRNMFIMLISIMVGAIIITYFAADIINRSQITTLTTLHTQQITDLNSRNENFTNYMLQGSIKMDAARETREVANLHFDFALYWFDLALKNNDTGFAVQSMKNCTDAKTQYLSAAESFNKSIPYFLTAKNFTNMSKYLEVIGYYVGFAQAGRNVTLLRYDASELLRQAAENISNGHLENVTSILANFSLIETAVDGAQQQYDQYRQQIDGYLFFSEIREIP